MPAAGPRRTNICQRGAGADGTAEIDNEDGHMGDIRVLVVDDHVLARSGVGAVLSETAGMVVVGECDDRAQVIEVADAVHPDVVVMDLRMPVIDGGQATRTLLARRPGVRVLILTGRVSPHMVEQAAAAGAVGCLVKNGEATGLVNAVRAVAAGESAWPWDRP